MLCNFAKRFPRYIARFLERGSHFSRAFREESVTDLMAANLSILGHQFVDVDFPDEPKTGADLEIIFVSNSSHKFFRLLIQAKRVYGKGQVWTRHSYRHLDHRTKGTNKLQAEVLTDAAKAEPATYPLYAFYHRQQTCELAHRNGLGRGKHVRNIEGVNLADGHWIAHQIITKKGNKEKLRELKTVGYCWQFLFGLSDLFCPISVVPYIGNYAAEDDSFFMMSKRQLVRPIFPTPNDIRKRLIDNRMGPLGNEEWFAERLQILLPAVPSLANMSKEVIDQPLAMRRAFIFSP